MFKLPRYQNVLSQSNITIQSHIVPVHSSNCKTLDVFLKEKLQTLIMLLSLNCSPTFSHFVKLNSLCTAFLVTANSTLEDGALCATSET